MKNLRPVLLLAGALCGANAGASDAPDAQLDSLVGMSLADMLEVDLGTGTSKFVRQAPAVAYVISGDDIRRLGARNLLEVLQGVPGFFLYNLRANFNEPVADLRGGFSERGGQVLFMLDGRPLRMVDNMTMPEILRLPMHLVERIEVVRGPVSALYGADALTGAVNVITKKRPDEAGISTGSFGQRELWAGKSGRSGPFDWAISANHSRERETLTAQILRQPVRSYTESVEREYRDLTLRLTAGPWSLTTWAMRSGKDEAGGPPAQGPQGQPFPPPQGAPAQEAPPSQTQGRSRHQHLELAYADRIDDKTDLRASVVRTTFEGGTESAAAAAAGLILPKRGETHQSADLTLTRSLPEAHRLRLNLGLTRERRERGDNPPGPQFGAREGRSLVLQDEYAFAPDWELTAGWRIDHFSDFGSANNPRLGLVWNTSAVLTSKLMFGQAFRPPVFTGADPVARQVASETMRNVELAFDLRPHEQLRTALNLYRYRAHDLYVAGEGELPPAGRGLGVRHGWRRRRKCPRSRAIPPRVRWRGH
ncbi:MAG: TonB-dependent receptor [Burkholderiaceae bacterium]|nr:TonB-dependent receptor [Burkholderiaceae bacterium]